MSANLLPLLQSGFRPGHSTETAVLRVLSDLLEAVVDDDITALALLDLLAAFDTVDHSFLCKWPRLTFGLGGQVLEYGSVLISMATCSMFDVACSSHSLCCLSVESLRVRSWLNPVCTLLS